MANGNLNRIEQGSLVCKMMYRAYDSSEKLLRHENLVMRAVQNEVRGQSLESCNTATKIMGLVMAALCNRAGHYIFALWFLLLLFFLA